MPILRPVDALSDSDAETVRPAEPRQNSEPVPGPLPDAVIDEVNELTDSSSRSAELRDIGLRRRRRKRKRSRAVLESDRKKRLTHEAHCRALLGRVCKSCKRSCLNVFLQRDRFRRFMEFRANWKSVHKLDQDKIVIQLHVVLICCWMSVAFFMEIKMAPLVESST